MFENEEKMVLTFIDHLHVSSTPWGTVKVATEFFYQRGRTDLVVVSGGNLIAFEAKLNKWRIALQQAYRNKCFADVSYVILPEREARIASRYQGEFERRGVGLCFVNSSGINIVYEADIALPLQPWLHKKALEYIEQEDGRHGTAS